MLTTLQFHIEGPGAEAMADELAALLHEQFAADARRQEPDDAQDTPSLPVRMVRLLLDLPQNGQSAPARAFGQDHAMGDKLRTLVHWAKKRKGTSFAYAVTPRGRTIPLDKATPGDFLS
jgi:hypothetical protein